MKYFVIACSVLHFMVGDEKQLANNKQLAIMLQASINVTHIAKCCCYANNKFDAEPWEFIFGEFC